MAEGAGTVKLACVFCFVNGHTEKAFSVVSGYAVCKVHLQKSIIKDKGKLRFKI